MEIPNEKAAQSLVSNALVHWERRQEMIKANRQEREPDLEQWDLDFQAQQVLSAQLDAASDVVTALRWGTDLQDRGPAFIDSVLKALRDQADASKAKETDILMDAQERR
jgi:hypothetical protein